jgi:hypothetical protein
LSPSLPTKSANNRSVCKGMKIIQMAQFVEPINNLLHEAGWDSDRSINIDLFKRKLEEDGYVLSLAVKDFLKEFGGLKIAFGRYDSTDHFHFDVITAVEGIHPAWIHQDYSIRLNNHNLCIIGQAYSNHLTLVMDDDGKVYGGFDDELFFIANSGREAIVNICLDRKPEKIL